QYRIGSITKTFTATAIMQLRDEGKLALEDRLGRHIDGSRREPTIRSLLAHLSGLQREPPGDRWETLDFSAPDGLAASLAEAEEVLRAGERWHYSNLAFGLLGEVVERLSGRPWGEVIAERILEPLELSRITIDAEEPSARGYLVEPYREGVRLERPVDTLAWAPAGQLWGTVRDLCRWAAFLAEPDERVLSRATGEEMRTFQSLADHERWTSAYGLGLNLRRDGERIVVGHGGSMPGFIAGCYVSPKDKIGAVVLTNSTSAQVVELTLKLIAKTAEAMPVEPEPWRPEDPPPAEIERLLGSWWMEGTEFVFRWRGGKLEAKPPIAPEHEPPSVFEQLDPDRFRTVSGPERGELLRLLRSEHGDVERMNWAGYPMTRSARPFA
ncbi:MAG: beta-lactamase family protein, partial [Actinomycetota bacterium]|nr:beta-lactamase family protein [Actinomycetota bacterium]